MQTNQIYDQKVIFYQNQRRIKDQMAGLKSLLSL